MDELRWILLIAGIVFLLIVYVTSRKRKQLEHENLSSELNSKQSELDELGLSIQGKVSDLTSHEYADLSRRISVSSDIENPRLTSSQEHIEPVVDEIAKETSTVAQRVELPVEDKIISIYWIANPSSPIQGSELLDMTEQVDMEFGEMGIFHYYVEHPGGRESLFCLANIQNPGNFDLETLPVLESPGLVFFLKLPLAGKSIDALDAMLTTAEKFRKRFAGELRDDRRSVLSQQRIDVLREEVVEFDFKRHSLSNT